MLEKKHIVICGSMSNYQEMLACQKKLERHYIPSIVPKEENDLIQRLSVEDFNVFKRDVSNQYLRKIREKNVIAILVVNGTKESTPNYIGANTFAEIAMAFCWRRRIFLLYDIFDGFRDELMAWEAEPLKGDIGRVIDFYNRMVQVEEAQMRLFDDW